MEDTTEFPFLSTGAARHDGWAPAHHARFLAILAETGNVRVSARRCGFSAQSAYVQRRRDPLFALGWAAALLLARDHADQVLADRAIEGVEEPIFYRGEQVGTRRRYDTRLLLAHLARLDRLAEDEEAQRAAGRFDELLAIVAGEDVPAAFGPAEDGPWRQDREPFAAAGATEAQLAVIAKRTASPKRFDPGAEKALDKAIMRVGNAAHAAAEAEWDAWFARACARVDTLRVDAPGAEEAPAEFKSMDPVNSVNFVNFDPRSELPAGPPLDFRPPLRQWPAPTSSFGCRSSVRDSWCAGSAGA